MLDNIEKALNETFTELFYNNFMWLIWLIAIAIIIVFIFAIIHSSSDNKNFNELNKKIEKLEKKLEMLIEKHNRVASKTINNSKSITLEEIAAEIKDLKNNLNK